MFLRESGYRTAGKRDLMKEYPRLFVLVFCVSVCADHAYSQNWLKHVIMEQGHCDTEND
tara:strand:+ start:309 stop:485 length:177 start_codon:yes stop_codon:yes gene_type:complete